MRSAPGRRADQPALRADLPMRPVGEQQAGRDGQGCARANPSRLAFGVRRAAAELAAAGGGGAASPDALGRADRAAEPGGAAAAAREAGRCSAPGDLTTAPRIPAAGGRRRRSTSCFSTRRRSRTSARRFRSLGCRAPPAPIMPVPGEVVNPFSDQGGDRRQARTSRSPPCPGQAVAAPEAGRVVFAAPFRSYGKLLIIEHQREYHTLLWGFAELDVAKGDRGADRPDRRRDG